MNSYFDQAKLYVDTEIGKDYCIQEGSIKDLTDFYCFTYQSRKHAKTGNFEDILIGPGYLFIDKQNDRIFSFGSNVSFEEALSELRKKTFQELEIKKTIKTFDVQKQFEVKVLLVMKSQILVDTLLKYRITYIIPEVIGSAIFRIAKNYRKNLLFEKLNDSPIIFHGINQNDLPELIIELIKNRSCQFEILERKEKNLAKYLDKASKTDLDPIW